MGDLQILEELGRGGMGIVFKAKQLSLDRIVAVKMLLSDQHTDPMRVARFQAEARAAAKLEHDHIVKVYQVGECEAGHYISMEYIEGESLESWVRRGRLSFKSCIMATTMIAHAIQHAHAQGIVHRDLKPANILIDKKHRPVITDFGIAKFMGQESRLTQKGDILGTPAFMSPEQAGQNPEEVGPRSDIYALGAILYMLLTSRPPYDEGNALRTILKLIGPDMPTPIRNFRPNVPAELDAIAMKALAKRPEDRYPTADLMAMELRGLLKRMQRGELASDSVEAPRSTGVAESADLKGLLDRNILQQMTGQQGGNRTNPAGGVRRTPVPKEPGRLRDDHIGEYAGSLETAPATATPADSHGPRNPANQTSQPMDHASAYDSILAPRTPTESNEAPAGSAKRPTPAPGDSARKTTADGGARTLVVILQAADSGQQVRLKRSPVVLGRSPDCNLVIKAADISKQHCQLTIMADHVVVEDMGSANGTYINDKQIKKATLRDKDRLRLGEHEFVVRMGYPKNASA